MNQTATVTYQDVVDAARRIASCVERTPTVRGRALEDRFGAQLFLKLEILQRSGSFKERGAANKLMQLSDAERRAGVIAVSAGNHAQGVAYQGSRLGIASTIVMPTTTPLVKIRRTEAFGARVVLAGSTIADAFDRAQEIVAREGLTMVHPFDDPMIIAGQGTTALEMLADAPDLDILVVAVGGGGLISGMAVVARELRPNLQIIGVQAREYPSYHALRHGVGAGTDVTGAGTTIADGIATQTVQWESALTRRIADQLVDDVVLASELELERATFTFLEEEKLLAEGAGAAPLAVLLAQPERFVGKRVGLVVSGGNMDTGLLANVIQRMHVREGRVVRMRIELTDRPGMLATVAQIIGECGANILDVAHRRMFSDVHSKNADLDVTVELRAPEDAQVLAARLEGAGFPTRILSTTERGS